MNLLHPKEINNLPDDLLVNFHGRLHAYYTDLTAGARKYNREDIVNQHLFAYQELQNRDLKHKMIDALDDETMQLGKIFMSLPTDDSLQEELLLLSLDDGELDKALASPGEWSSEEFAKPARGMPGIYLVPPHGRLLAQKKKTLIIKPVKFSKYTGTPVIVVSGKKAYAEIVLKLPFEINLDEFEDLRDQHRITAAEYNHWWKGKRKLYAYAFSVQKIYDSPINVDIPAGIQTFLHSVQIKKQISPILQTALDNLQDTVVIPDFISISGRTVIDEPSNDIDFIWRAKFDDDSLILQLREFLMKFTRSFPAELQEEFHHVDSPSGPAWSYKSVADLVLRFKDKPIIELENDSYAYYKHNVEKQINDTILFRIIGRMRKSQRFETLDIEEPKKTLEGAEAYKLYDKISKSSQVWVLRCAIQDKREPVTIDLSKLVKESDLSVRWNADIAHPEWQGLDDSRLWEMLDGYDHRDIGQHAYWSTFSKKFDIPPPLGSIIAIKPAKLLRFLGNQGNIHYTWLWPSIIQIMSSEKSPDNVADLEERHLIDEEFETGKQLTAIDKSCKDNDSYDYHKRASQSSVYLVALPKFKESLWSLQKELSLEINEYADERGLHLTLAYFDTFELNDLEGLNKAFKDIGEITFSGEVLDIFGADSDVLVLHGTIDEKVREKVHELRRKYSSNDEFDFNPHITLGKIPGSEKLPKIQEQLKKQSLLVELGMPMITFYNSTRIDKSQHRRDKCMMCDISPEYEVKWAEGMAHAWFCEKHFWEWQKSAHDLKNWSDIDHVKQVENGEAVKKWEDNTNPDILDHLKFGIAGYSKAKKDFKIKLMEAFTPIKSRQGYRENEFQVGQENELWETWARGYIDKSTKAKQKVAIIDIDNTCVSADERLKRCTKDGEIDWDCAFSDDEVLRDNVIPGAQEVANEISKFGIDIIYLTGRSEKCRNGTEQSLSKHGFPGGEIIMRSWGDVRDDEVTKRGELLKLQEKFEIIGAADDDWNGKLGTMYTDLSIKHFKTIEELKNAIQDDAFFAR